MSILKHTINDQSIRDIENDNILDETRTEKKYFLGICFWSKKSTDKSEYVKVKKRELGYGK